jgi:hypothetical protein
LQSNENVPRENNAKPPWKRSNPRNTTGKSKKLTTEQKSEARARARTAGRPYPNLVDNMAVAQKRKSARKHRSRKQR